MDLIVLGSGTTVPHGDRGCAAYALVADDGSVLLLDAGPGSSRMYARVGIDVRRVVGSCVTHHHADHVTELPLLLFMANVLEPPLHEGWLLAGPVGHARFVEAMVGAFAPGLARSDGAHRLVEMRHGDSVSVGPFVVEAAEVTHIPHALGYRVRCDGATFAYSGDSGPGAPLEGLVRDADLAVLECSYAPERESSMHLSTRTAAFTAANARVRSLVLSHFYPEALATDVTASIRGAGYAGPLALATDGMRIAVEVPR